MAAARLWRARRTSNCGLSQSIEVVRPLLHHRASLSHEFGPVIGRTKRARLAMRQLGLDDVRMHIELLDHERARHGAEAVRSHIVVAVAHSAKRPAQGVLAHGSLAAEQAREHIAAMTGEGFQLAQDLDRLASKRHQVRPATLFALDAAFSSLPSEWSIAPNRNQSLAIPFDGCFLDAEKAVPTAARRHASVAGPRTTKWREAAARR